MKTFTALFLLATLPLVGLGATLAVQPAQAQSDPMQIAYAEYATLISQDGNSPINVRDGASTRSYARHIGYGGDRVEVLDRTVGDDGYMWYFVRFTVSNATGWVRGDFVWLDSE